MMQEKHLDELKDKLIHRGFIAEDRGIQIRVEEPGSVLRDAELTADFEQVVRDETKRIERSANVVTAVVVDGHRADVAFLVGETADKDMVEGMLERFQHRIYNGVTES